MAAKPDTAAAPNVAIPPALIVAVMIVMVLGGVAFWYVQWRAANPEKPPALTDEAKDYVENLALSAVQLKATEAYSGAAVVEILGTISNKGSRALSSIEVTCVFYDAYGQIVLRERVPMVRETSGGLKPGESKLFRLPFDSLPESWNQALPQLVIAHIEFS